jgi:DNA-binding FadR family transcriptional regulator
MPKTPRPADGRRLAEVVAAQVEQDIIARGWPVGEVLGSEPELIERMGVSRAVFREAVRIVEHHNVARMRRGPGGGLVVTEPESDGVQRAVALYLRFAGVKREDLFATRVTLETACAAQAAERITEEGIERLRAVQEMEQEMHLEAVTTGHSHDLHILIAELTGNPVNTLFVRVLTELTRQQQVPHEDVESALAAYRRAHDGLVDAIISGDPALAQHRMRRHLAGVSAVVADDPQSLSPLTPVLEAEAKPTAPSKPRPKPKAKKAAAADKPAPAAAAKKPAAKRPRKPRAEPAG